MSSGVDSSGSFIGPTENPGGSLFIDGSFAAAEGVVIAGNNPADGSEGFSYPAATAEEVGRAVTSSRRALNGIWLETSPGACVKSSSVILPVPLWLMRVGWRPMTLSTRENRSAWRWGKCQSPRDLFGITQKQ